MRRPDESSSDEAWVEQVRHGSTEAFENLFKTFYADLVEFVLLEVRERDAAQELVQEVFFDIWRRGTAWRPEGSLRPYLYGAARKKCLMHFRRVRHQGRREAEIEIESMVDDESPDAALRYLELKRSADAAVAALPERRRLVFTLSRHHGLTYAEIAAVLGISINTVEDHMVKAIRFLRDRLALYLSVTL